MGEFEFSRFVWHRLRHIDWFGCFLMACMFICALALGYAGYSYAVARGVIAPSYTAEQALQDLTPEEQDALAGWTVVIYDCDSPSRAIVGLCEPSTQTISIYSPGYGRTLLHEVGHAMGYINGEWDAVSYRLNPDGEEHRADAYADNHIDGGCAFLGPIIHAESVPDVRLAKQDEHPEIPVKTKPSSGSTTIYVQILPSPVTVTAGGVTYQR